MWINEHLPKAHLLVRVQQVLTVTQFPSVLQLRPECSRAPRWQTSYHRQGTRISELSSSEKETEVSVLEFAVQRNRSGLLLLMLSFAEELEYE